MRKGEANAKEKVREVANDEGEREEATLPTSADWARRAEPEGEVDASLRMQTRRGRREPEAEEGKRLVRRRLPIRGAEARRLEAEEEIALRVRMQRGRREPEARERKRLVRRQNPRQRPK